MSSHEPTPVHVSFVGLSSIPELTDLDIGVRIFDSVERFRTSEPVAHELVVFSEKLNADEQEALVAVARHRDAVAILASSEDPQATFAQLLNLGADTFVCEPIRAEVVGRIATQERLARQRPGRRPRPTPARAFVGNSPAIEQVCSRLWVIAPSTAPVLITGESGTGKELAARAIHRLSPRRFHPLVALNCGAIAPDLIASELFGHERGAFTGAEARRIGCFEAANGGTLFLDEVGELQPDLQVNLLRALEEGHIRRVGGTERVPVDVRIIAATNRDLRGAIDEGRFREDLFYRLNVLHLHLPALRERLVDVRVLWEHFVEAAANTEGQPAPQTADATLDRLEGYPWPGNVRELENAARAAVAMRPLATLTPTSLPKHCRSGESTLEDVRIPGMTLEELERVAIRKTYQATGSVRRTAEILGVSERKIWYRLKQYRDEDSEADDDPRPHLALVEDDADLRTALRDLLLPSYIVREFSSAEDFLERVQSGEFDIVVSDVRMPGKSGIQLLNELTERGIEAPVILISAYANDETRREALKTGALALLDKPIDAIALGRHLERATGASPDELH